MSNQTPKQLGYTMPAEWETHLATWLAWPNDDDYFEDRMKSIENVYLKMISTLHKDELIKVLVLNEKVEARVKKAMSVVGIDLTKIIFYQTKYVDVWIRDYGPTFIKNGDTKAWVKWHYGGYNKFPELLPDNEIFLNLKDEVGFQMIDAGINLEGGAIASNGMGTFLTTRECLIENRHLGTESEVDLILNKFLGATNVIWLNKGLFNDHTDGHVDDVACFVNSSKILCAYEDDVKDENYERLLENFKILENALDQNGKKFEIVKLPMPHMHYNDGDKNHSNMKAPVSYVNFYIGNKVVLVPTFNDPNDQKALSIIKSCFPSREVIGIDCRDVIYGGGTLHCITQQEPV